MSKCDYNLLSCTSVEQFERVDAVQNEKHDTSKCKSCIVIQKVYLKFNLCDLPDKTKDPSKQENETNSVQLMVDYFSALIDFEDKSVIDVVLSKNLNVDSSSYNNENNNKSEKVRNNAR